MKRVVINHKTTKFESNSQRNVLTTTSVFSCYQSQNYKIWKQFTTSPNVTTALAKLLSIAKLQNLKAIHNKRVRRECFWLVVINHKTTKFESNSQLLVKHLPLLICCYQSQNYKIWKQFTTKKVHLIILKMLLSITKLQNLKAIHNCAISGVTKLKVVINHKTTKFESNSQRCCVLCNASDSCYQSQNYKIWKQFTTSY